MLLKIYVHIRHFSDIILGVYVLKVEWNSCGPSYLSSYVRPSYNELTEQTCEAMILLKENVEDGFTGQGWFSLFCKGRLKFRRKLLDNSRNYLIFFFSGHIHTLELYTCALCLMYINC